MVGCALHSLHLRYCSLQLEPADGSPGVLQGCAGLTALALDDCSVEDAPAAAAAAIAALPDLQRLRLGHLEDLQGNSLVAMDGSCLAVLQQLTHLSLVCKGLKGNQLAELSQLSVLTNLKHLELTGLSGGVPGGLPSQLDKLTCLDIDLGKHLPFCPQPCST
jgi:hypothetical protein